MSKSVLLNPVKLAGGLGLELSNRCVLAPLTRARSGKSQVPNDANVLYYTQRATAGLVITEGAIMSKQAMGWQGIINIINIMIIMIIIVIIIIIGLGAAAIYAPEVLSLSHYYYQSCYLSISLSLSSLTLDE